MDKKVKLEQLNGKLVLPVPFKKDQVGQEYFVVENVDGTIIYTPINKKQVNIFESKEFKNHDFQADLKDPKLMELKPVGKERWFDDDNI